MMMRKAVFALFFLPVILMATRVVMIVHDMNGTGIAGSRRVHWLSRMHCGTQHRKDQSKKDESPRHCVSAYHAGPTSATLHRFEPALLQGLVVAAWL